MPAHEKLENLDQESHVIWTNLEARLAKRRTKKSSSSVEYRSTLFKYSFGGIVRSNQV